MLTELAQKFRIDPSDIPGEAVIFGQTSGMREIRGQIDGVLDRDIPVLIQGESGTGKELVAKFLHTRSSRGNAPFVKLNCAAIPAKVLESELLSYEQRAFAGTDTGKLGVVQIADGGSLFLDKIGDLDCGLQAKLLHMLRQGRFAQIGGYEEEISRVRFICATSVDIEDVADGRSFHREVFHQTELVHLRLLTLRERKEDIPQLCEFFMQKLSKKFRISPQQLTPATLLLLQQWNWPGNLRELENWIARVIILGSAKTLVEELRDQLEKAKESRRRNPQPRDLKEALTETPSAEVRAAILRVLQANDWSRHKAARELKMSYHTLLYKLGGSSVQLRRRSHRTVPPTPPGSDSGG